MKIKKRLTEKMHRIVDLIKRHPWRTFFLVLIIGLSFTLKMIELQTGAQHEFYGSDPYASIENAHDFIYNGKDINFYLNPLATLYLIFIYGIFGEHLWLAKFIQILASFAIPFFLYYFAKKYFGEVAGFIAAVLSLIHPAIVFYSAHSWAEAWIIFFFCAMLYLFTRIMEAPERKGNWWRALLIGVFTAISSLGKIWMGLVGATLVLFILFQQFDRKELVSFLKKSVKIGGFALLGVIVILVPWIIYTSITAGYFVFINMNSQTNLYIGNNPEGEIAYTSKAYNWNYYNSINISGGNCGNLMSVASGESWSKKQEEYHRKCAGKYATNYILDNPGKFAKKMSEFTFKYWLFPNLEFYQRYIKSPKTLLFTLWVIWVLALVGFLVSLSNWKSFLPFYIIMLIVWFITGMAFYLARYKVGLAPITTLFAAGGLYTLWYFVFGKGSKETKK